MKLNRRQTILVGLGFMAILAFWQFYDQVIPYVLENRFHLSTLVTNIIMAADNVLAVFLLPVFGALSDRTETRLGKRTPYILFGTIASSVLLALLGFFEESTNAMAFYICLGALLLAMSVYRSPAVAYMPDITPKPLRSRANAIVNLVGYMGGIFATVMMMLLLHSEKAADGASVYSENQSFLPIFLVIAGFMLVAVLVMTFTLKENRLRLPPEQEETVAGEGGKLPREVRKSLVFLLLSVALWYCAYNAVTTAYSRYCVEIWGVDLGASSSYLLVATVAAIAAFLPLGLISGKLGRKKTVLLGVVLMAVCYALAMTIKKPSAVMYVIFGLVGIGWAAINVNSFPMVVEMSNAGNVGKYTGYYYTFSMAAQIVTPILSGMFITWWGYRVLFPYAVGMMVLAFLTMCFVRHGDSKPAVKQGIEIFEDLDT